MQIVQNLNNLIGITEEKKNEYVRVFGNPSRKEVLTIDDVVKISKLMNHEKIGRMLKDVLWNNSIIPGLLHNLIVLINQKRFFIFHDLKGEKRFIILPYKESDNTSLEYRSNLLLQAGIAYTKYVDSNEEDKMNLWKQFVGYVERIKIDIAKDVFSKNFKDLYKMKFRGISGVCLTSNLTEDFIELPKWYADKHKLKLGDLVIVTRDPVQNIFLTAKIGGLTRNETRVNSNMFTWLGGDHDGDKVQFIPVDKFIEENKEFIDDPLKLKEELLNLLPTSFIQSEEKRMLLENFGSTL